MVSAMLTGFEQIAVILLAAAVPLFLGYLIGRWWVLLLSLAPLAFGYIAYRDKEWGLMVLYVPPVAVMLGAGIGLAKLTRKRERRRPRDRFPTLL